MSPRQMVRSNQLDARRATLNFSPQVRNAFSDLAAAVHFDADFDGGAKNILQSWSEDQPQIVHEVLIAFPFIAEQVFGHIHTTNDERAREAWREVCNQMPEAGFVLSQSSARSK